MLFNKISIIGVGLIGASFSLAARNHDITHHISGFGRNEKNLKKAQEKGIIDHYSLSLEEVCSNADLIVLASPVGTFLEISKCFLPYLKKGTIITDVGSVKSSFIYGIEALLPDGIYFVGCHPLAGSDQSGSDYADRELFKNAHCIITPTDSTDKNALNIIVNVWKKFGSVVEMFSPEVHDIILSSISHVPHLLAYALVNSIFDIDKTYLKFASSGFKDTTRIAMGSPEMWRDICIANKDHIIDHIKAFKQRLDTIVNALESFDTKAIEREFKLASDLRKTLSKRL